MFEIWILLHALKQKKRQIYHRLDTVTHSYKYSEDTRYKLLGYKIFYVDAEISVEVESSQ